MKAWIVESAYGPPWLAYNESEFADLEEVATEIEIDMAALFPGATMVAYNRPKPAGGYEIVNAFPPETREHYTILAALRFWQRMGNIIGIPEMKIARGQGVERLSHAEIDKLCERISK